MPPSGAAAQEVGRANHLRGFEIVRAVHLVPEPFTPDNGLLTPTLKWRRPALLLRFRSEMNAMYDQLARQ
jgi:long-chain acyl-CoA synthetase